jgi:glycosyltransferase involved in cell wall biosynthesis
LTDIFLFESAYIAGRFDVRVGAHNGVRRVVANGISPTEFTPAVANADAADLLYVGELRAAKGIDTLLEAVAQVGRTRGRVPPTVLVGSGPDQAALTELAQRLGIESFVSFRGQMPVREAFKLGRVLVVPSRAESMPYIVLEAAGARVPMIATNVGGIPEIFGPYRNRLGPPNDPANLQARIEATLALPEAERQAQAAELATHVAERFSIQTMVNSVMAGYAEALALRRRPFAGPATAASHN